MGGYLGFLPVTMQSMSPMEKESGREERAFGLQGEARAAFERLSISFGDQAS